MIRTDAVPRAVVGAALADGGWRCERVLRTVSDTTVVLVQTAEGMPATLKLAEPGPGAASLIREREILARLGSDERLGSWRRLLPVPLSWGNAGGTAYLLTSRLPGTDGGPLTPARAGHLTTAAFAAIAPLHTLEAAAGEIGSALLDDWVTGPVEQVRQAVRRHRAAALAAGRLAAVLWDTLAGAQVPLGWSHGDFHPGNLLVSRGEVSGIVDWDAAREHDLTATDLAFWLLTTPPPGRRWEFGTAVAQRLGSPDCWTLAEARLLGDAAVALGHGLLLLTWLRHVAGNLAKSGRYAASPLWLHRNVLPVLRQVAGG